jgi:hypothetical protein
MTTEQRPPGRNKRIGLVDMSQRDLRVVPSWNKCDLCEKNVDALVVFCLPDVTARDVNLCPSCLREALRLVDDAALSPAERSLKRVVEALDEISAEKERE